MAMILSSNDGYEVRPDDSMPDVINQPNRMAIPRNTIPRARWRASEAPNNPERRRLRWQLFGFKQSCRKHHPGGTVVTTKMTGHEGNQHHRCSPGQVCLSIRILARRRI